MSVDLRGFHYEADAILARRRWELDAAIAELGRLQGELRVLRLGLAELREQLQSHCLTFTDARVAHIDPAAHAASLHWLARLQGRIAAQAVRVEGVERARDETAQRLRELQSKVDALDAHRDDAKADYATAQLARDAAEADRTWLSRRATDPRPAASSEETTS